MENHGKEEAMRTGLLVFLGLAVLTIVEYFVPLLIDSAVLLLIIALLKAALIINYFMHVYRLWREESH